MQERVESMTITMQSSRKATQFEIMQQEHIDQLKREKAELISALLRCNHFAVATKNRVSNGGDARDILTGLDSIAEYSKVAIEAAKEAGK